MFKTKACSGRRSSALFIQTTCARITALGLIGMLVACGGGGGDGGGGGGNNGGGGGAPALVYTGNLNPAVITTSNAAILTANIFGGTDSSGAFSAAAPSGSSGARDLARSLGRAVRATPLPPSSTAPRVTAEPVDFGVAGCKSGGSVRVFGDLSVSGTGTLTFIWSNCNTGDDSTLDGTATMRIDAVDPVRDVTLDSTFNFQRVTLTTPMASGTVSGSVRSQLDLASNSETTTSNLVSLDSAGRMTKTENFVVVDVADDISASAPRLLSEKIKGRLFDGIHGYVDIVTNADLAFSGSAPQFPNTGELLLTGAVMAHIRVTPFSSTAVTLHLDLDGDNVFEITASLAWTELAGPAGTDLRDTDGDGMHNSWETAHGLNPMNSADAAMDPDGDGANNLAEYHAGTDPQNLNSHP